MVSKRVVLLLGALLLLLSQVASAMSYYEPTPQGTVGVRQPMIAQQFVLGPGEKIAFAEMTIDGKTVVPAWDESGRVFYTPPQPLQPGSYTVRLKVQVSTGRPGYTYAPVESTFRITVAPDATGGPAAPGPEEGRALAWVNRYRAAAGLAPLRYDERLAAAALGHARYLIANPTQVERDGHRQEPGRPYFFAETVGGRAKYYAYDGGSAEVIHFVARAEDAIDSWIDTLYHRIPLIHPGMTAMGYGLAAGPDDGLVNVLQIGPFNPEAGMVRWPYADQVAVPPDWDGLESPNPLALYPGAQGPVGYPITLTFGGRPQRLRLTAGSLTGPDGKTVAVYRYDPVNDPHLDDTVSLIPVAPLALNSRYTVRLQGEVDLGQGLRPFDESWSFTTAAERRASVRSRVASVGSPGRELRQVRLEGYGFGSGFQAFLGGLPVEELTLHSEGQLSFRPPVGYRGEAADLLLVSPAGVEVQWRSIFTGAEDYTQPAVASFRELGLVVGGERLTQPALQHGSGALLLPVAALTRLGGKAEAVPGIGRTYWRLGDHSGEYTLGRLTASVWEEALRLALPVQERLGTTYVDAAFVQALTGAQLVTQDGVLHLSRLVGGMRDIDGHWAAEAIAKLLADGIVSGYGDGTFRPDAPLSRAAFVKMLVGAGGLPLVRGADGGLSDVQGHWVSEQGFLGAAVTAGLVKPAEYPRGRFEPDREIGREEMAVMVARSLGLEAEALARAATVKGGSAQIGGRSFRDIATWSRPGHIAVAVEAGIITGYPAADGRFDFLPQRSATRAEAATMVVRRLER